MKDTKIDEQIRFVKKVFDAIVSITERSGKELMSPSLDHVTYYPRYIFELSKFGNFSFRTNINRGIMPGASEVKVLYHFSEGHTDCVLDVSFRDSGDLAVIFVNNRTSWTFQKFNPDERWQHELLRDLRMERIWLLFKKLIRIVFPAIPKPHATRY